MLSRRNTEFAKNYILDIAKKESMFKECKGFTMNFSGGRWFLYADFGYTIKIYEVIDEDNGITFVPLA